jgi:hypothetical protein
LLVSCELLQIQVVLIEEGMMGHENFQAKGTFEHYLLLGHPKQWFGSVDQGLKLQA